MEPYQHAVYNFEVSYLCSWPLKKGMKAFGLFCTKIWGNTWLDVAHESTVIFDDQFKASNFLRPIRAFLVLY